MSDCIAPIAIGAPCHATVKHLTDPTGHTGRSAPSLEDLIVETFARSSQRAPTVRAGVPANSVGRNTDFRQLFSPDENNRCWYHNDLLTLDKGVYDNPHWPADPTRRNVPYRSTMVWPIRKVLREGTATTPHELYIHGFLAIDCPEADVLDYDRHFDLGAAYADHLLSVLWDTHELRNVHLAVMAPGEAGASAESGNGHDR